MYRMQKMSLAVAAENFVGGDVIAFGGFVVAVRQKLREESDLQMAKLCKTWKKSVNTYSYSVQSSINRPNSTARSWKYRMEEFAMSKSRMHSIELSGGYPFQGCRHYNIGTGVCISLWWTNPAYLACVTDWGGTCSGGRRRTDTL